MLHSDSSVSTSSSATAKEDVETSAVFSSSQSVVSRKTVPHVFILYFLEAIKHPPFMYVSKLAACCAMLFLERSDNELFQALCNKWVVCFLSNRQKIIQHQVAFGKLMQPEANEEMSETTEVCSASASSLHSGTLSTVTSSLLATAAQNSWQNSSDQHSANSSGIFPASGGLSPSAVTDVQEGGLLLSVPTVSGSKDVDGEMEHTKKEVIHHFLNVLNASAFRYFSSNWSKIDFLMQVNREYACYVRDVVLPMCVALEPNVGVDEIHQKSSLLSPFPSLNRFLFPSSATSKFIAPGSTSLRNTVEISRERSSFSSCTPPVQSPSGKSIQSFQDLLTVERCSSTAGIPIQNFSTEDYCSLSSCVSPPSASLAPAEQMNCHSLSPSSVVELAQSSHRAKNVSKEDLTVSRASATAQTRGDNVDTDVLTTTVKKNDAHAVASELSKPHSHRLDSSSALLSHSQELSSSVSSKNVHSRRFFQRLEEKSASRIMHVTSDNYPQFMKDNTTGRLIVFHGMYCTKSNALRKVLDVFMERHPINPMPKVAVVNAVSEPQLSVLYNISWFPSIIYSPPFSADGNSSTNESRYVRTVQFPSPTSAIPSMGVKQFSDSKYHQLGEVKASSTSDTNTLHSSVDSKKNSTEMKCQMGIVTDLYCTNASRKEKDIFPQDFTHGALSTEEKKKKINSCCAEKNKDFSSSPVTPTQPDSQLHATRSSCTSPSPISPTDFAASLSSKKEDTWISLMKNYTNDIENMFGCSTFKELVGDANGRAYNFPSSEILTSSSERFSFPQSQSRSTEAYQTKCASPRGKTVHKMATALDVQRDEKVNEIYGLTSSKTETKPASPVSTMCSTPASKTTGHYAAFPPVDSALPDTERMETLRGVYRVFPSNRAPSVHVLAEWIRSEGTYVATDASLHFGRESSPPLKKNHYLNSLLVSTASSQSPTPVTSTTDTEPAILPTTMNSSEYLFNNGSAPPGENEKDPTEYDSAHNAGIRAGVPIESAMLLTSDELKASLHAAVTFLKRIDRPADVSILREVDVATSLTSLSFLSPLTASLFPFITSYSNLSSTPSFFPSPLSSVVPELLPACALQKTDTSPFLIPSKDAGENDEIDSRVAIDNEKMGPIGTSQPFFMFLGGGMAAGKSTVLRSIYQSSWCKERVGRRDGDDVVVVAADEFKPRNFDPKNQEAHRNSTKAAELLLIQSINQCRSIVLDGTMMWKPFVLAVIEVVRAAQTTIFKPAKDEYSETGKEQYFEFARARPTPYPYPYKILCLGITVEPDKAVPLGLLRQFSSGRGVRIKDQLRSFKLFSQHFPLYSTLVDVVDLIDNNTPADVEKGEFPHIIAVKKEFDTDLRIMDEKGFSLFQRHRSINVFADNVDELFLED